MLNPGRGSFLLLPRVMLVRELDRRTAAHGHNYPPRQPASATIHPIVESFDCDNEQAFAHHPLGDPADPPGQTPSYGSHSDQSTLRGFSESDENAQFGHKLDGKCGKVGQ
jgi:hypothetical protein